jgi:hypothetical protein
MDKLMADENWFERLVVKVEASRGPLDPAQLCGFFVMCTEFLAKHIDDEDPVVALDRTVEIALEPS